MEPKSVALGWLVQGHRILFLYGYLFLCSFGPGHGSSVVLQLYSLAQPRKLEVLHYIYLKGPYSRSWGPTENHSANPKNRLLPPLHLYLFTFLTEKEEDWDELVVRNEVERIRI